MLNWDPGLDLLLYSNLVHQLWLVWKVQMSSMEEQKWVWQLSMFTSPEQIVTVALFLPFLFLLFYSKSPQQSFHCLKIPPCLTSTWLQNSLQIYWLIWLLEFLVLLYRNKRALKWIFVHLQRVFLADAELWEIIWKKPTYCSPWHW